MGKKKLKPGDKLVVALGSHDYYCVIYKVKKKEINGLQTTGIFIEESQEVH